MQQSVQQSVQQPVQEQEFEETRQRRAPSQKSEGIKTRSSSKKENEDRGRNSAPAEASKADRQNSRSKLLSGLPIVGSNYNSEPPTNLSEFKRRTSNPTDQ